MLQHLIKRETGVHFLSNKKCCDPKVLFIDSLLHQIHTVATSVHALNSPLTAAALNCDPKMCSQVCWNRNRGGMQGDLGQDNRDVSRNRVHFLCSSEELGLLQKYQSGLPFPSPGDLPDPGVEPRSPALQADAFPSEPILERASKSSFLHVLLQAFDYFPSTDPSSLFSVSGCSTVLHPLLTTK